jgi:hypothetical protein
MRKAALGRAIQGPYANEINRRPAEIYPPWGTFHSTGHKPSNWLPDPNFPEEPKKLSRW